MRKIIIFSLVMVCVIFFSVNSFAEPKSNEFLTGASVYYDARYYPEFAYSNYPNSGAESHSGAYIVISATVENYSELQDLELENLRIVAEHKAEAGPGKPDFEVTLREGSPECAGVWPFLNDGQYWSVRLQPSDWMLGVWEFTLRDDEKIVHEKIEVDILRFYNPPEPTGIQILTQRRDGSKWLAWNRIGDPEEEDSSHVEYRIVHMVNAGCQDESYAIPPNNIQIDYVLTPGNLIRVRIPGGWNPGDLVRIENRVYGSPDGVVHMGRASRYLYLPQNLWEGL